MAIPSTISDVTVASESRRNVLFVCDSFPPSMEMGARTCSQIARYLKYYGWQPTILTVKEEYIEEQFRERKDTLKEYGLSGSIVRAGLLPHPLDFYRWVKLRFGNQNDPAVDPLKNGKSEGIVNEAPEDAEGGLRRWLISVLGIPDF